MLVVHGLPPSWLLLPACQGDGEEHAAGDGLSLLCARCITAGDGWVTEEELTTALGWQQVVGVS
jgi:hypothetical protein